MNSQKFFSLMMLGSLLLLIFLFSAAWLAWAAGPPTSVVISGPLAGAPNTTYTFTAAINPVTATLPITYTWQATGQTPVTHTNILSHTDGITFTWSVTGEQAITVTAGNSAGVVSANAHFSIATLIVPDDYPTIQQAVNTASPGDTVYVRAGVYTEHVTIGKALTLQGEARATTIITGSGSGAVLYVTADGVNIFGLTARNGNRGIHLYQADNCHLNDVLAAFNADSGLFLQASTYNMVVNSVVAANVYGIQMGDQGSHHNTFQNITAYANTLYGFMGYAGSDDTKILDSDIHGSGRGVAMGFSQNWTIENTAIYSNLTGIYFDSANYATVRNCNIYSNTQGVRFTGLWADYHTFVGNRIYANPEAGLYFANDAHNNTIKENEIYNNGWGVRIGKYPTRPSYGNVFYHNSFVNNTLNALVEQDDYANTWDNGYPSGGNYWDDYTGPDVYRGPAQNQPGGDGIGDTAYVVTSTTNIDRYPLAFTISATNDSPTELGRLTTLTATMVAGNGFTCTWAFGDGEISHDGVVTHVYPAVGVYRASITASKSIIILTTTVNVTIVPKQVYLPLILKPSLTTLYIQSINTGGATVRILDLSDTQLLSCIVGNNVTMLCGTLPSVGSYKIIAQTARCGLLGPITFTDATGGTITRIVFCN